MQSKSSLPEQLKNLYSDPILYEEEYTYIDDVPFWQAFVKNNGIRSLLELGCGTGRIARQLAPLLERYAGIDLSEPFLQGFRQLNPGIMQNPNHSIHHGDFSSFTLGESFDAVILPFNTLTHLYTQAEAQGLLQCVERHLRPGGLFALDYFNPEMQYLLNHDVEQKQEEFTHTESGEHYVIYETNRYDAAAQVNHIKRIYRAQGSGRELTLDLPMRIYFPMELDALLETRLSIQHKYGSYSMAPFAGSSPRQIIVATQQAPPVHNA